jgi:hypothetical protein
MNMNFPRITFGIIVVNGEPFTQYCLRSLYPFAHEIIVVEGGHTGAAPVCTPDGHSTDGTLETLYRFKAEEDPENKVQIVTRDGFWPQKDEFGADRTPQSRAYAERATGDYLWQVDIDEFYLPEDIEKVRQILRENPWITAVEFKTLSFWGGLPYNVDTTAHFRTPDRYPRHFHWGDIYRRLFKWGAGYRYVTHEPPTVYDDQGRNLRDMHLMTADQLVRRGIVMYHYSLMFPSQVRMKTRLYQNEKPVVCADLTIWAEDCYFHLKHPFAVHNARGYWSWLERYTGSHPPAVYQMMADIKAGRVDCELRRTDDIEALLNSFSYRFARTLLQLYELVWLVPWNRFKRTPVGRQVYRVVYGIQHPGKLMEYLRRQL